MSNIFIYDLIIFNGGRAERKIRYFLIILLFVKYFGFIILILIFLNIILSSININFDDFVMYYDLNS